MAARSCASATRISRRGSPKAGTAEIAEHAEQNKLCALCELRGFCIYSDYPHDGRVRARLLCRVARVHSELAIEQHIGAHAEYAIPRPMAIADRHSRPHPDPGP